MPVSVLVAFRGDGQRLRLWDYIQSRLARFFPELEVVVGTDDGTDPFNKCVALNDAANHASGDAFLILDADTWLRSERISMAIEAADAKQTWVRPYSTKLKLLAEDTERILADDEWDGSTDGISQYEAKTMYWPAPPFVIPRFMWDGVGGMDERFRGWGQEDDAFAVTVRALYGPPMVIRGQSVHLHHPRIGKSGKDFWSGQTGSNVELAEEYRAAGRRMETMKTFLEARDG